MCCLHLASGDVEVIEWRARQSDGAVSLREKELCDSVRDRLTGPGSVPWSVAVLHAVIGSKTGLVYPSLGLVRELQAEFGERLLVVVDACQLRCQLDMLQQYVDLSAFVLITGVLCWCCWHFLSPSVLFDRGVTSLVHHRVLSREQILLRSSLLRWPADSPVSCNGTGSQPRVAVLLAARGLAKLSDAL